MAQSEERPRRSTMTANTHSSELETARSRSRVNRWAVAVGLSRKLPLILAAAALICGVATYGAITGSFSPAGPNSRTILILLNIDLIILLLIGALVAWRLVRLWIARRQGSVGSRLHTRMVALFSIVAVTPAILVAVFSALFFSFGLQSWFNDRVSTALERSLAVGKAYLSDHQQFIRADLLSMVSAINRIGPRLLENPSGFNGFLEDLATERSLTEAIVVRADGKVLAKTKLSFVLEFDPLPQALLQRAAGGEVVVVTSENSDRVRALAAIDSMIGAFLYVGRFVDSDVLKHMERLSRAVDEYQVLESERTGIQITFTMIYVIVALLLLLAAVWVGLTFANGLVRPISSLVAAAERVRGGDLTARVIEGPEGDEIASLSRAFNRMTGQLGSQREELIEANRQLDERRRFTETVLFGVSAGVLGLDSDGRIFLPNRSALELLSATAQDLVGKPIEDAVPEMAELMAAVRDGEHRTAQDQVGLVRKDRARTLLVRVAVEGSGGTGQGYVVTFDDITELVNAQRAAAWTDVARRIAHEIKNPLTPIQLSAERLKRKYLRDILDEPEVFAQCIDTIVRQVGGIRRMVDEFSAFARMPAPVRVTGDLVEISRNALSMQKMARPDIAFDANLPDDIVAVQCDARLVGQALTNLLQNALDAIDGRDPDQESVAEQGRIVVKVSTMNGNVPRVTVIDNGRGLPADMRDRLTEPYVTTRAKGTGLGLAIVKKIMEDHDGELVLADTPGGGASVSLIFPAASNVPNALSNNAIDDVTEASHA